MKRFIIEVLIYMLRWQISTPVMSLIILCAKNAGVISNWKQVAIANLFCSLPFFFLDKEILVHLDKWLRRKFHEL